MGAQLRLLVIFLVATGICHGHSLVFPTAQALALEQQQDVASEILLFGKISSHPEWAEAFGHYNGLNAHPMVSGTDQVTAVQDCPHLQPGPAYDIRLHEGTVSARLGIEIRPIDFERITSNAIATLSGWEGTDITISPSTLTYTPENQDDPQYFFTTAEHDADADNDLVRVVVCTAGGGPNVQWYRTVLNFIVIDDEARGLEVMPDRLTLEEGTSGSFTVRLKQEPLFPGVLVDLSGHTGTDLTLSPNFLVFNTQNWQDPQTVRLTAAEDADITDDQVTLTLTASLGGYTGITHSVDVTIIDNDSAGLRISGDSGLEDAGPLTFTVTVDPPNPVQAVTVRYETVDQSAMAGSDYVAQAGTLTFSPGEVRREVQVPLVDDTIEEMEERFLLRLTEPEHALLEIAEATGTILDNEARVTVSIQDVTVNESSPAAVFPVTLSGLSSRAISMTYVTLDETAVAGQDYTQVSGTIRFAPGELHQEIRVPILNDEETEETETFLVQLTGENVLDGTGQGTIEDDDEPITVGIYDGDVVEGAGPIQFPVRLNRASSEVVTVQFASSDETGTAPSDYRKVRGIVIFERGSTDGRILVGVNDDDLIEPEETFRITLSRARNAVIGQGIGTGTITDNDGNSQVSVAGAGLTEDAATFVIGLSRATNTAVVVRYATEEGSAAAGTDFVPVAGSLTFAPGEISKEVRVRLLSQRGAAWTAKSFSLVLVSAVNATLSASRAEAVIQEDDVETRILEAYVARTLRTSSSQIIEAVSRRSETLSQCRVPDQSLMQSGIWRPHLGELLSGCGWRVTEGGWSMWGQGAFARFQGRDGTLSLHSDVTTVMLGADHLWKSGIMTGILTAHSIGHGTYRMAVHSGETASIYTGVYPYLTYQREAGPRAWLLLGLGRGSADVDAVDSKIQGELMALGLTGTMASMRWFHLRYAADVFLTLAEVGPSTDLNIRRVRALVQGRVRLGSMQPYMEVALRHDGGDAETGLGLELGGGLRWGRPMGRLRAELTSRTLVLHSADGFQDWGISAIIQYGNADGRGLTAQVRPMWGLVYGNNLWQPGQHWRTRPGGHQDQVEMELRYGTALGRLRGLGRSFVGVTMHQTGQDYHLGYQLNVQQGIQVSVATSAQEHYTTGGLRSYGIHARMALRW